MPVHYRRSHEYPTATQFHLSSQTKLFHVITHTHPTFQPGLPHYPQDQRHKMKNFLIALFTSLT